MATKLSRRSWFETVAAGLGGASVVSGQNQPFPVHDTRAVIMNGPYLLAPDEQSVTVVWTTDTPCHSKVMYGVSEPDREAENAVNGLLPVGLVHAIHITGLQPGRTYRYKVASTRVVKMKSYWPEKGQPVESPVYAFTTLDRSKPAIAFDLITDTHADAGRIAALNKLLNWSNTDFLAHLGDAFDGVESEEAIWANFLDPVTRTMEHSRPLVYVRGNHDTRGLAARALIRHVPLDGERFYYARDHGPIHFVILDTGEDKDDATNVYARLNRFRAYRAEELGWFEQHVRTDARMREAPFRVLLMHSPSWGWVDGRAAEWTAVANQGRFDLVISGHTHRFSHATPEKTGNTYHGLVIGPENLGRVEADARELRVSVVARDGKPVETFTIARRA